MKHLSYTSIFALSSLLLVSCAHQSAPKEKLAGWRVEEKGQVTTGMPNYVLSAEAFAAATVEEAKRGLANDEQMAQELEESDLRPSLRRVYFRVLYQQFRDLKAVSADSAQLTTCPQFHHDKLMIDEAPVVSTTLFGAQLARPTEAELAYYPEWLLPAQAGAQSATIWSRGGDSKKLMTKALSVHTKKIHKELRVLCEEGSSDAYFRLENMVTYFAGRPELQAQKGLAAFLKIPAFSTMLLLRSASQADASPLSAHDQKLIEEVKGAHFERYIGEVRKRRFQHTTGAL